MKKSSKTQAFDFCKMMRDSKKKQYYTLIHKIYETRIKNDINDTFTL